MADDDFTRGGGMTAQHAPVPIGPYRVAPTDGPEKFNTIRVPLVPVACWRLNDPAFAFDSSFISADFAPELAKLASLVESNPDCPASLFAHADPVGSDNINKTISDRRALAIYATLTRKPDLWEELYATPVDGDSWGTSSIQSMLAKVSDAAGSPYYAGGVDGDYGPATTDAVRRFQQDAGLASDGQAGPATRKVLFGAYMDTLCTDDSGQRFTMKPEEFLCGGVDAGGKIAMQGCSRFNPIALLPNSEEGQSDWPRNDDNALNRRVLLFLFRKGSKVRPDQWPCPRVKESSDGCKAQFWPDGEQRRKNGDAMRLYKDTRDTMACRFYDRFARRSPCEGSVPSGRAIHVRFDPPQELKYELHVGDTVETGTLRAGDLLVRAVSRSVDSATLSVWPSRFDTLDDAGSEGCLWTLRIMDLPSTDELAGVQSRLNNLGYLAGPADGTDSFLTASAIRSFQDDNELEPRASQADLADPQTRAMIQRIYGA